MSLIKGTRVFTKEGWKPVEELTTEDDILVRKFAGLTTFDRAFAIEEHQFKGDACLVSANQWSVGVTPNHTMEYDVADDHRYAKGIKTVTKLASDGVIDSHHKLYRSFNYMSETTGKIVIKIQNPDGTKSTRTIDHEDWAVLLAFTLVDGYFHKYKGKLATLKFILGKNEHRYKEISQILSKYDIPHGIFLDKYGRKGVNVYKQSNLTRIMRLAVGSTVRKEMGVSKKFIYYTDKPILRLFIDTIMSIAGSPVQNRPNQWQLYTQSEKLAKDLEMIGMLTGITARFRWNSTARNFVVWIIKKQNRAYSVKQIKRYHYDGPVYNIILFDGLVLTSNGKGVPIWMKPM